jgi:tetratricopeptide (TPR) repeat protein
MKSRLLAFAFALLAPGTLSAEVPQAARAAVEQRAYPEAERLLRERLAQEPGDAEARFLLARVLAWQERHAVALREYERLLEAEPDNSDYLLGKAQTHLWNHEPESALPLLSKARRLAPGYEDVWRAQIMALVALGDESRLRQARIIRDEARRRFPDSRWEFRGIE